MYIRIKSRCCHVLPSYIIRHLDLSLLTPLIWISILIPHYGIVIIGPWPSVADLRHYLPFKSTFVVISASYGSMLIPKAASVVCVGVFW